MPEEPKILVVDDDENICHILRLMLEQKGYRVATLLEGRMAVVDIKKHGSDYALVILDLILPGMGGEEVFRRIREVHPNLPVLVFTGGHLAGVKYMEQLGPTMLLPKPSSRTKLLEHIATMIATHPHP